MRTSLLDRILVSTALLVVLVAAASFAWLGVARFRQTREATSGTRSVAYASSEIPEVVKARNEWRPAHAQSRGTEWVYDVFTPPEISYDDHARQFTVALPEDSRGGNRHAPAPGVALLAIKREPFSLQLIGYVGGEGNYRGAFENLQTAEVILGGAGLKVPGLELEVTKLVVERRPTPETEGTSLRRWVATAVVHDAQTGDDHVLTAGERALTNGLRAVLAENPDQGDSVVELETGGQFETAGHTFRVERIQAEPPSVDLLELPADAAPFRLGLTPQLPAGTSVADPVTALSVDEH